MESCSYSSSSCSKEDEQNIFSKNPHSIIPVFQISSAPFSFIQSTPFFRQPLNSNLNFQSLTAASNVVGEVQKSMASNVDKCLKMLDGLRWCQNGVIDTVLSFSTYLQRCCQIPRRNCQNLSMLSTQNFAAILPGDSVAGVVVASGISNFLNIYNTLLIVRLVLTWFPNAPPAVVSPLSTLCDPYLNIFRGIIPPLGGTLDLSPILAFLVLNAFTSTAAALPAELPPSHHITNTTSQKKWITRLAATTNK